MKPKTQRITAEETKRALHGGPEHRNAVVQARFPNPNCVGEGARIFRAIYNMMEDTCCSNYL